MTETTNRTRGEFIFGLVFFVSVVIGVWSTAADIRRWLFDEDKIPVTSADDEPIIANVNKDGAWSFNTPREMDERLLSAVEDLCQGQFVPSVFAHIRANRFFDEALDEAKNIPSHDDEFEPLRQLIMDDVLNTLLNRVDEDDLHLFREYFTEKRHTFESMSRVMNKLVMYKELKIRRKNNAR